jgi:hypothetical protein
MIAWKWTFHAGSEYKCFVTFLAFQFNCNQIGFLPDVTFVIGGTNFNISAEYHVQQNVSDDYLNF